MCVQEAGGGRVRANMERWQYKIIRFIYKTKSNAKTTLQSQGVERKGIPGRQDTCWSYKQESGAHTGKTEESGVLSELALSSGRASGAKMILCLTSF